MKTQTSSRRYPAKPRVLRALLERIESNHYATGMRLPSERTIAEEFDTDRSAVRVALADLANMGLVVREPGRRPYVADIRPKKLSSPSAATLQTIAMIGCHIDLSTTAVQRGINEALRTLKAPYRLVVFNTVNQLGYSLPALEKEALSVIEEKGIAGAVVWYIGSDETLPNIKQASRHVPLVFVDRYPPGLRCDFVGIDNKRAARTAVEYLIDLGHKDIGFLQSAGEGTTITQRLLGYKDALNLRGLYAGDDFVFQMGHLVFQSDNGVNNRWQRKAVEHFQSLERRPTAIFASNDAIAYGFIAEAQQMGWRVPEDVSVVGFDDLHQYTPNTPLLTTIHQPFHEMGERAGELLLERLKSPAPDEVPFQHILLPAPLVVRSTCRAL